MTVKTSQENKEFWRKTKFLHIFPSAASNQNFSTHFDFFLNSITIEK